MESAQISGKVFRFLSTMHPSLSKTERKRYSEFDPDRWYPWTAEIAAEFTDLMKRSPRDTSFARGFAYAATKALPEDTKISPTELVGGLATFPAAYGDPSGSGFEVSMETPGIAAVSYRGMPGFSNVCIAVAGELTQRLQAIGAHAVDVRHAAGCRLQGAEACNFEVRWAAEPGDVVPPAAASRPAGPAPAPAAPAPRVEAPAPPASRPAEAAAAPAAAVRPEPAATVRTPPPATEPRAAKEPARTAPAPRPAVATPAPATAAPAPAPAAPAPAASGGGTAQDLFEQLRSRLVDAEQQAARHAELEGRIAALEAALAEAESRAEVAEVTLADLRQRLRDLADGI